MAALFQGFRSLIENSPDAISLIDSSGEIVYASPSTAGLFGYRPEELLGRNCTELTHPEDRDYSIRALQEVVAKPPGPLQWDARVRRKNGNYVWMECTVSNLLFEFEVKAIVMHQRDIDARKSAEVERQRHAGELTAAKLRWEEFAYTAAHDLQAPLRAISCYTDMLVKRTPMDAESRQMAQYVVDGAARMSALVGDLLSFADTGVPKPPVRVDLQTVLAQVKSNLLPAIQASGATVTAGCLPVIRSNEILMIRLFQNLIANALAYRGQDPVEIHVDAAQHGSDWVIRIKDNGVGIEPENHARIFLPFKRLAGAESPGSGLGLAICKKIVEGLGGAIWVESELGRGSTFCFTVLAPSEE